MNTRIPALLAAALLAAHLVGAPVATAIPAPVVDPAMVPADGTPGPEEPMRQSNLCAGAIALPEPSVTTATPGFAMLNIAAAWRFSTGNGVAVAVIDTGITPSPRLRVVPGGDYITGGDGLSDCDAHGTVVASVIAAAPQGIPQPAPMPANPAFPTSDTRPPAPPPPPPQSGPLAPAPLAGPLAPAPLAGPDGVAGVAPHATLISIRQSSRAYTARNPAATEGGRKAGTVATLARAIVHAANLGAKVINVSVTACVPAADPLDQRSIGAAVWYAATVKDAVIVAAAGNEGEDGCTANPDFDPLDPDDPRDWHQVKTVSSPAWFCDYVLAVGAVDRTGAPAGRSLAGPWVGVGAPGTSIVGLSPQGGGPVNAYPAARPGDNAVPFWGTSFSAAYVSGVAALVRARFPALSAHQVIHRITQTAHNPARGVDNHVGYGLVDPVAALTFDVPPGDLTFTDAERRLLALPAPPDPPDRRAHTIAVIGAAAVVFGAVLTALIVRARRAR